MSAPDDETKEKSEAGINQMYALEEQLAQLRAELELSQQHLKENDSELSFECHQNMKLRAALDEARKVIIKCEWVHDYRDNYGDHEGDYCPVCGQQDTEGHKPDCALASYLAAHPEADK